MEAPGSRLAEVDKQPLADIHDSAFVIPHSSFVILHSALLVVILEFWIS
jgi:hypothetical protein